MPPTRLSRLELKIMDALWSRGPLSIREMQEAFPDGRRPAYSTVQTTVYRMEAKGALRRARKIGNAHIFEPLVSRQAAQRRLIDDLLDLFGGRAQPLVVQLLGSGRLSMEDVREAARVAEELRRKEAP